MQSQSINYTKDLFAYPITISFAPLIHWLPMAETTILLRGGFMFLTRWQSWRLFWYFWSETAMLLWVGLMSYTGERPGFIGDTNVICEYKAYCWSPMAMHPQSCFPPPKLDLKLLVLAMHSLYITSRDKKVVFPWVHISGLWVNYSQIFSTAGADTTTIMVFFLL